MADLAVEPPVASAEAATRQALQRAGRIRSAAVGFGVFAVVFGIFLQATVGGLGGAHAMGVVALSREPGDKALVVTNRGLRRLGVDLEPLAWIAGWGSKELVLSPPGGGRLLEVRPVVMAAPDRATGGTKR